MIAHPVLTYGVAAPDSSSIDVDSLDVENLSDVEDCVLFGWAHRRSERLPCAWLQYAGGVWCAYDANYDLYWSVLSQHHLFSSGFSADACVVCCSVCFVDS